MRRYSRIANLSVARHLGLKLDEETYRRLVHGYLGGDTPYVPRFAAQAITETERIAEQYRIFHWQLEFPQVFFHAMGNLRRDASGFDAVVGNPPYVRQETLGNAKDFSPSQYEVYHSAADLYAYFVERGIGLLNGAGHFSYVVSNKWLRARYGKPLRRWLKRRRIEELVDFGDLPVFGKVSAYPCILRVGMGQPSGGFRAAKPASLGFRDLAAHVRTIGFLVDQLPLDDGGWALVDRKTRALLEKLRATGVPLEEYVQGKIYRGVLTGLNAAFVVDEATRGRLIAEDPKSAEVIKPLLVGRNIKRYQVPRSDRYLILFPKGWTNAHVSKPEQAWEWLRESYPAVAAHLAPFEQRARRRCDKGDYWWELRACDYYDEFEKPKIVWPNMCVRPRFTFDTTSLYISAPANVLPLSLALSYVVGILNSSLMDWFMMQTAAERGGGFLEYKPVYVRDLSIPSGNGAIIARIAEGVRILLEEPNPRHDVLTAHSSSARSHVDREIDLAIYELYGLIGEEIAIVEEGME